MINNTSLGLNMNSNESSEKTKMSFPKVEKEVHNWKEGCRHWVSSPKNTDNYRHERSFIWRWRTTIKCIYRKLKTRTQYPMRPKVSRREVKLV